MSANNDKKKTITWQFEANAFGLAFLFLVVTMCIIAIITVWRGV